MHWLTVLSTQLQLSNPLVELLSIKNWRAPLTSNPQPVIGFVILIYDHFLTLPEEIEYVWKRPKKNFISVIFLLNRYIVPLVLTIDVYDKLGLALNLNTSVSFIALVVP